MHTNEHPSSQVLVSDRLLSRKEAAAFLKVSPKTLANWASTRRYNLPVVKIGGRRLYRLSVLHAFVKAGETRMDLESDK